MWHNSVMTRRPRKCFDDIGDRFDRSLAYEEIGFTDAPFNFAVVLDKKEKIIRSAINLKIPEMVSGTG